MWGGRARQAQRVPQEHRPQGRQQQAPRCQQGPHPLEQAVVVLPLQRQHQQRAYFLPTAERAVQQREQRILRGLCR